MKFSEGLDIDSVLSLNAPNKALVPALLRRSLNELRRRKPLSQLPSPETIFALVPGCCLARSFLKQAAGNWIKTVGMRLRLSRIKLESHYLMRSKPDMHVL